MKYLLFDFNGTIVDDVFLSLESINYCRKKYINKGPLSLSEYRDIFTFPVIEYYKKADFNFDVLDWDEVANCWMDHYKKHHHECKIFKGVVELINDAHSKGYRCVVLSASEINILKLQLKELNVYDLFDDIVGSDNIYAYSKVESAKAYFKGVDLSDSILLGDTSHDKLVADGLGCKCYLISNGHESHERLLKSCEFVYNDIREIKL